MARFLTGFAFCRRWTAILPQPAMALPVLSFPAVFINAAHGQNGFLTAALFIGASLTMTAQPALAGLCFGCLVFKPQIAIVIPIALLAARRWTTLVAAAATASVLIVASVAVFGVDTWRAFIASGPGVNFVLQQTGPEQMPSIFAAVLLLHGNMATAYTLNICVILGVCVVLFGALRRRPGTPGEGALIAAAALVSTPTCTTMILRSSRCRSPGC